MQEANLVSSFNRSKITNSASGDRYFNQKTSNSWWSSSKSWILSGIKHSEITPLCCAETVEVALTEFITM